MRTVEKITGVLVAVDFSTLHQRICQGVDLQGNEESDYELWSPSGLNQEACLMGHKTIYTRRKRESQCFNGEKFDRKIFQEDCLCTEEDWECDINFSRSIDGPCIPDEDNEINYTPPDDCTDTYEVSQGYRKIVGDTCFDGIDHFSLILPCPSKYFAKSNTTSYVYIIILLFWCIYCAYKGYFDKWTKHGKEFLKKYKVSK